MQISQAAIEQAIKAAAVNANPPIIAAYLFGSRATGDVWAQSDVDVALLFGESDAADQLEISSQVAEAIEMLARNQILPRELTDEMTQAVRMRNVIVHHYPGVNLQAVHKVIQEDLGDVANSCAEIMAYLD